jgi:putative SOS response-associated peptidase YedK
MCGRATLTTPSEVLADLFRLDEVPDIAPRFNVAPGQPIAILRAIPAEPGARRVEVARWGIAQVPHEGDPHDGRRAPLILARVESLFTRAPFREAAARRRCVALVDGFYEWQGSGSGRQPFHFRRRDGLPFALASIWARGKDGALECALLTTAARSPVKEVHDRMPIPIAPGSQAAWLDPSVTAERVVRSLATVDPDADLVSAPVGTFVNDARHEGAACLEPAAQRSLF